jgi:hypothetical protein
MYHTFFKCRLCSSTEHSVEFEKVILDKYKVKYYRCSTCLSLQTEQPFWLDEAYTNVKESGGKDVGALQRTINNFVKVYLICKYLEVNNVVDVGGGDGLLCRFLRDFGVNCFSNDKYVVPRYSNGFTLPNFSTPDVLLCFEVIEHFYDPDSELKSLFTMNPKVLIASTQIYVNQSHEWNYLGDTHVFFYSKKAMLITAKRYGYNLIIHGDHLIFYKNNVRSGLRAAVEIIYNSFVFRFLKAILINAKPIGVAADHDQLNR